MPHSKEFVLSKVPLSEIENGLHIRGSYEINEPQEAAIKGSNTCEIDLNLHVVEDLIVVTGDVLFVGEYECDRCLKSYEDKAQFKVSTEVECTDMFFNLESVLGEEIVSSIPMTHVCSSSCKGLCTKCGANLNVQSCDCAAC